jgi:hypothetical protein
MRAGRAMSSQLDSHTIDFRDRTKFTEIDRILVPEATMGVMRELV